MSTEQRILAAAHHLLSTGGIDAVSTRAVSKAAGVQPPAIYRHFGDKRGLLDAVTSYAFDLYLHEKRNRPQVSDPVDDLRRGWDLHVRFGVENPDVYAAIYGDPRRTRESSAAAAAAAVLSGIIQRIAEADRLRVDPATAATLAHSAGRGLVLSLADINDPQERERLAVTAREAMIAAVTLSPQAPGDDRSAAQRAAVTLTASLPRLAAFSDAERTLLTEWLGRVTTD